MKEKQLKRKEVYDSSFLRVYEDDVDINGNSAKRVVVDHCGAVNIIGVTNENKLILVKQYRYALEQYTLETPAGKLDKNKSPLQTAHEELEEETGYITDELSYVGEFYCTPGFCNEKVHIYFTDQLKKAKNPKACDDDEFIELITVTISEAKDLIKRGIICDYKTVHAVMIYEQYLNKTLKL